MRQIFIYVMKILQVVYNIQKWLQWLYPLKSNEKLLLLAGYKNKKCFTLGLFYKPIVKILRMLSLILRIS